MFGENIYGDIKNIINNKIVSINSKKKKYTMKIISNQFMVTKISVDLHFPYHIWSRKNNTIIKKVNRIITKVFIFSIYLFSKFYFLFLF